MTVRVVNGSNVLATGLFVEHYQNYDVQWNGNGGETIFFQNEMPYDPPNQAAWMNGSSDGYAAYEVAPNVTTHQAYGMGSYCYFNVNPAVVADHAFEAPDTPGVQFHDLLTVSLGGVGVIEHVINSTGGATPSNTTPVNVTSYPFVRASTISIALLTVGVDLVHFAKGQRKDEVTQRLLAGFTGAEGVLYVGRAQEKSNVWGTQRRYHADGRSYAWLVRSTAFINFFYFYCVDEDFGPFFIKFSTYFPFTAKLCINGNEWAKRQAAKAGIGFEPLDNGFAAVDDVAALQGICDSLGPVHIEALLRKWLAILPSPFTVEDRDAGYAYELSVLQAEFSLTQMLDAPVAGRIFFEQVLRDNLDIGRPDQISLVFGRRLVTRGRRRTPGTFRTRVITDGVTPSLHVDYKNSKIKQYHKLGKAIRTETTINDTRDFGLSKRLTNLPALRQIGFTANRRLLGVQTISHNPVRGAQAFTGLTAPIVMPGGTRIPGLRFGDPRNS